MMPTASAVAASRRTAVLLVLVMRRTFPLSAPMVSADGRDASILSSGHPVRP